jgi:hypothetical protein
MDAVNSKSMPRKSMRVATIFTGVAACTVGVTQVANAQDAAKNTSKHIGRTIRPAGRVNGSIRYVTDCGLKGIDGTWLHLEMSRLNSPSFCYGFRGEYASPPGIGVFQECGGNNHGWLAGHYQDGSHWSLHYGPGTAYHYLDAYSLSNVIINSWTGHDACR